MAANDTQGSADAANTAANEAKGKADAAEASASNARELEGQLRSDVARSELVLSASASGHILRPRLFSLLKDERAGNVSISCFTGADFDSTIFADNLAKAFGELQLECSPLSMEHRTTGRHDIQQMGRHGRNRQTTH
jgi:hypothetical protein